MKQLRNITSIILCLLALTASMYCFADDAVLHTEISGITNPVLMNVQNRLAIATASFGPVLSVANINTFYKNAPQNIKKAMEPYGYFKAVVHADLSHQGSSWTARFFVTPGPQVHIVGLDIDIAGPGRDDPALQKVLASIHLHNGQVFHAENYTQAKQNLFQTANEQGYLKAYFTESTVQIDLHSYTVHIVLHLDTGPRFYFGQVHFQQNTFSDEFLHRFMNFKPGQPFSGTELIKLQQNLSNSNFFREVNVNPNIAGATTDHLVPVDVTLVPSKSQQYNVGLGYGTFTGVRASVGMNFRHLTPGGHHLDLQVKASEVLSGLAAQYVIPGQNPLTDQYTIGANVQRFLPKNGSSTSESLSLGYVKTIDPWKFTTALTYLHEHFNISGNPTHNSRILYPSINATRTKADDLINTHFGTKIDVTLRGSSNSVGSNVTFMQTDVKGKWIFSPTSNSRVLVRGEFGYTVVDDLNILPLTLQYFAGGMDSVRGFPYSYFGPGRYLKTGSIELQHKLYGQLSGAVFYDVGTADEHLNSPPGQGVGIGLIYATPIGPVRGYFGYGFLRDKTRHTDFEFSLGPDL
jgi:translocation and assembly module TamA